MLQNFRKYALRHAGPCKWLGPRIKTMGACAQETAEISKLALARQPFASLFWELNSIGDIRPGTIDLAPMQACKDCLSEDDYPVQKENQDGLKKTTHGTQLCGQRCLTSGG